MRRRVGSGGGRVELGELDPVHLVHEPVAVLAAPETRVRHALVLAEVPVEVHVLLGAAFVGGEEAAPAVAALVGLLVVERADELGPELLESCGGEGHSGFAERRRRGGWCARLGRWREDARERLQ